MSSSRSSLSSAHSPVNALFGLFFNAPRPWRLSLGLGLVLFFSDCSLFHEQALLIKELARVHRSRHSRSPQPHADSSLLVNFAAYYLKDPTSASVNVCMHTWLLLAGC